MQPNPTSAGRPFRQIAAKEFNQFFASPVAYIFLASFVGLALFVFFWVESFFVRNIADVRPFFEWMPVLLIFLSAALTMRMWSEERRSGTLEFVLTMPASPWQFVLGKFVACNALLWVALLLTLPLPVSVALIADLDWGPVISAYLATMLLGAAYIAVGLYVSSRSDNQIVSLILTVLVAGALFLVGAPVFTDLAGTLGAEWLRALGTGARFESITRGVVDLRDVYYYLSLVVAFLALNHYSLLRAGWALDGNRVGHRRQRWFTGLVVVNALLANLWLAPLSQARLDTTEGGIYSLSDASRQYLGQLQEPLLIRGYFSAKTHPLLAPLVPQVRDLVKEYEIAGEGKVRVEFVDPVTDPDAEEEAGARYGIEPVAFQVTDRHQAALVNSYFHLLVSYGDEYEVLGFDDLIEVKLQGESGIDVLLRNPEYDITNAIRNVLYSYQSGGDLFANLPDKVEFTGYISAPDKLPASLVEYRSTVDQVMGEMAAESSGKLAVTLVEPEAHGDAVKQVIADRYGFQPMSSSLFDDNQFWFNMVLTSGERAVIMSADALKRNINQALKRFAPGYMKTIGLVAPESNPYLAAQGMGGKGYQVLEEALNHNYTARRIALDSGRVDDDIDLLMLMAPENLDDKALFAIDQFLMQGGTVIAATSPFISNFAGGLSARRLSSGLEQWLAHNGVTIGEQLVLDPVNAALAVPVPRQVGSITVQEMVLLDYPYFLDARGDGLNPANAATAGLPQLTVPWASPITVDAGEDSGRQADVLVQSSPQAWLSTDEDINPRLRPDGSSGFLPEGEQGRHAVAVAVKGRFDSWFAGKPSPLLSGANDAEAGAESEAGSPPDQAEVISGVIEHSSDAARLVVIASNDLAADPVMGMLGSVEGTQYLAPVQLLANLVDWSLADEGLLSIRARGHFNRTLPPMEAGQQAFVEYLNYGLAALAVLLVFLVRRWQRRRSLRRYSTMLAGSAS